MLMRLKNLYKQEGAMAELMRSQLIPDAEAKEVLQGQLKQVNDKIFALAGEDGGNLNQAIDKMQGEFDIKGTDVDIEKTTDVSGDGIEDATDTEVVAKLDADDLNDAGINSADYPDNAWITENTQKLLDAGLTEEDIEALQNAQGFERAVAQKEWMGTNISQIKLLLVMIYKSTVYRMILKLVKHGTQLLVKHYQTELYTAVLLNLRLKVLMQTEIQVTR